MHACGLLLASLRLQSMPISSVSSRSLAVVGMMPWLPTPTGMWSNNACIGGRQAGRQGEAGQAVRRWDVGQGRCSIRVAWQLACDTWRWPHHHTLDRSAI